VNSPTATDAVLQAAGLTKSYRSGEKQIEVLNGVELTVAAGESVSIRGESGSGKSTLLNLLAGLDHPDAGTIRWGREAAAPALRAHYLGMVFQAFYLIPELNARDNVLMAARIAGRLNGDARRETDEMLQRVGLGERGHHLPGQLSGGERQRVAVARALLNRPRLLLADEPTGNLDEHTGDAVIELLLSLVRETGTALVLVTHNPVHAAKTDRRQRLHEGRLEPA